MVGAGLWGIAAVVALAGVPEPAAGQAQTDMQLADIRGAGTLTIGGAALPIKVVSYTSLPSDHRLSLSVSTPTGLITLSGTKDAQDAAGHYSLEIDAVLSLAKSGPKDEAATGKCDIDLSSDGGVVHGIVCKATTPTGDVGLDFRGDGTPISYERLSP